MDSVVHKKAQSIMAELDIFLTSSLTSSHTSRPFSSDNWAKSVIFDAIFQNRSPVCCDAQKTLDVHLEFSKNRFCCGAQ
jgi:hypothetical protein